LGIVEAQSKHSRSTVEPQPVLAGPPEIAARINWLWSECERLGWSDGDHGPDCNELSAEWERIWLYEVEPHIKPLVESLVEPLTKPKSRKKVK